VGDFIFAAFRNVDYDSRPGFQVGGLRFLIVLGQLGFVVQLYIHVAFGGFDGQHVVADGHHGSDYVIEAAMCENWDGQSQ